MRPKTLALVIVGVLLFAGGFLGIGKKSALPIAHRRPRFPKLKRSSV
jgi:hypothetical protein